MKKIIIFLLIFSIIITNNYALFTKAFAVSQQQINANQPENENLGGPNQKTTPPGPTNIINIEDVVSTTNSMLQLASVNWKVLDINGFDQLQLEAWEDIANKLSESRNQNTELWQMFFVNNYQLNPDIVAKAGHDWNTLSKYDQRIMESLAFLTAPKHNGGAGREFLSLPVITKGYNTLNSSNKQTLKDKTAKEADEYSVEVDDRALEHLSPHGSDWGQAVDISAIDYIRGTVLIYKTDEEGEKLVKKQKIENKIPIQVAWQTDYRPEANQPFSLSKNRNFLSKSFFDGLFKNTSNSAFNSLLNSFLQEGKLGIELPTNLPISSDNIPQMIAQNIGLSAYLNEIGLPLSYKPGADLSQNGINLGASLIQEMSGNNLIASGLRGSNLRELETNIGREYFSQQMGLPENSLYGNTSSELITNLGRATMAERFNIDTRSLHDLTPDNITLRIGQGYLNKNLNLMRNTFSDKNNTLGDIKNHIGQEKADYIFSNPNMIDRYIGLSIGTTTDFYKGSLSPADYAKKVGDMQLEKFYQVFGQNNHSRKNWDAILGISGGTFETKTFGEDTDKQKDYFLANYIFTDEKIQDCNLTISLPIPIFNQVSTEDYFKNCYNTEFASNDAKLYGWLSQYTQPRNPYSTDDEKKQNLAERFFSGDDKVFYDIGLKILQRSLSTNTDMWSYLEQWLRENIDQSEHLAQISYPKLLTNDTTNAIYPDVYNKNFGFPEGDIERVFMLGRADEVFQRHGRQKIVDAFFQTSQNDDAHFLKKPETYEKYYSTDFFTYNFNVIAQDNDLGKNSSNADVSEIITLALQAVNYPEQTPDAYKNKDRVIFTITIADKIQHLIKKIKVEKPNINLENVEKAINNIIAKETIYDPRDYTKDQIKENYSRYHIVYGDFKNIFNVIQEKETIDEYLIKMGLEYFANVALDHPEPGMLYKANTSIVQSGYQESLTRLNDIVGDKFIDVEKNIINNSFNFKLGKTPKIESKDILGFVNGVPLYFASKIGSHIAEDAFQVEGFYSYMRGEKSGNELISGSPFHQNPNHDPSINLALGLFNEGSNIYQIGAQLASDNFNIDILKYYTDINFDSFQRFGDIFNSVFNISLFNNFVNPDIANIQEVSADFIKALLAGNIKGFINRIEANVRLGEYRSLLEGYKVSFPNIEDYIQLDFKDFMPIDELEELIYIVNNPEKIFILEEYGRFFQELSNINFDRSFKAVELAILGSMKESWGEGVDPRDMLNLYKALMNPSSTKEDIANHFAGFIENNTDLFENIPEDYKDIFKDFLSGNIDQSNISDLIVNVWLKDEEQSVKDSMKSALDLFNSLSDGNMSAEDIQKALKTLDKNMSDEEAAKIAGVFASMQKIQNGDFAGAIKDLKDRGILSDTDGNLDKLTNTLSAFEKFQRGDIEGGIKDLEKENLFGEGVDLDKIKGVMGAYEDFKSGNYDKAFEKLEQAGIDVGDTSMITGAYSAFEKISNGDYVGAIKTLKDNEVIQFSDEASYNKAIGALGAYNKFQSGDYAGGLKELKNNGIIKDIKSLDKINGVFDAAQMIQSGNYAGAIKSMSDIFGTETSESLSSATDILNIAQNIQNKNYSGAIQSMKNSELFKSMEGQEQVFENLQLIHDLQNGNYPGLVKFLDNKTEIFADMTDIQKNAITGLVSMGLSGNFSAQNAALLASRYFGYQGLSLGAFGVISPAALISGISNPASLVSSILSQYLTSALAGALGTFGASIVVSLLMGAIFGGSTRMEYHWTACGYYPTYDKEETIEGEKYENELKIVNDAKAKAVGSNSAEDWGKYIEARVEYDAIPTDEIDEDDLMTQDIKYSDAAITNENIEEIQEYGLNSVVEWAKSKDNPKFKCMDPVNGGGGVFINDTQEFTDEQKQQMAKYKIRVLLGNLLRMKDRTLKSRTENFINSPIPMPYVSHHTQDKNLLHFLPTKAIAQQDIAYDPEIAKQAHDYKLLFDFNSSGLDLRPSQIMTYGSDEFQSKLDLTTAGETDINYSPLPDTGIAYVNPLYKKNIVSVISNYFKKSFLKKTYAQDIASPINLEENDVSWFYVLRDKLWGDNFGSPGSQDILLEKQDTKEGFGYNKRMWGHIHYGY